MKKIIICLLIVTLAFSLVACAELDDKKEPSTPSEQGGSVEEDTNDAENTDKEEAKEDDE